MLRRTKPAWGGVGIAGLVCASLIGCGGSGGGGAGATSAVAVAIDNANNLFTFNVDSPSAISGLVPIQTLLPTERVVGIDVRPATGALYGLAVDTNGAGSAARLLVIDPGTGATLQIGSPFTVPIADPTGRYAFDFNPSVDRIRVVNAADASFRLHPITGALIGPDTPINPPGQAIQAVAYDRNTTGASLTTLFALNLTTGMLQTIGGINAVPSANGGTLNNVGALAVSADASSGTSFDVQGVGVPPNGDALAVLDGDPTPGIAMGLYRINLQTGAAALVGTVGTGTVPIGGMTVR
jgi:hypothetical protein